MTCEIMLTFQVNNRLADGMSNTVGSCDDVGHTNDIAILTSCTVFKGFIFEENRVNSILALLTNAK